MDAESGGDVDRSSQSAAGRAGAAGDHGIDDVEGRADRRGRRAHLRRAHKRLMLTRSTSRRASGTTNSPVRRRRARPAIVADLRLCRSGNGAVLRDLPAHQLDRDRPRAPAPSRTGPATPWRPTSGTTSATRRGQPDLLEHAIERASSTVSRRCTFGAVSDGTSAPAGSSSSACARPSAGRPAARCVAADTRRGGDLHGATGCRRPSSESGTDAHSTNVTLLISRSVVDACQHPLDGRLAQEAHALRRAPPS